MLHCEEEALKLQEIIGYRFKDSNLLVEALSHSSYVNEKKLNKTACYERLEFLGDAVLECVSSNWLYRQNTSANEGTLSRIRSSMVCEKALAPCARRLNLGKYILLGRGEKLANGQDKPSILADVLEAVVGALFLDAGFETATKFVEHNILECAVEDDVPVVDNKTMLQELVQGKNLGNCVYNIVSSSGPDHDKVFVVEVCVGDKTCGRGRGASKKAAEMEAAGEAIKYLKSK